MNSESGKTNPSVLIVDDELFNLEILSEYLGDAGYEAICAENGNEALRQLDEYEKGFDALLLDRMMPDMDGIEVLSRIKARPELETIPVIMQTGMATNDDIRTGPQAGAYYYLTKPYDRETLLSVLNTAVTDYQRYRTLEQEVMQTTRTMSLMTSGQFTIRTLDEGHNLVSLLAAASPDCQKVAIGLSELLINAVEHGNLGITYEEKTALNEKGEWQSEVERRLGLPEYSKKMVKVVYERRDTEVSFLIEDQGEGFEWNNYMEISPERAFDTHGRGIAMAKMVSFDRVEYMGKGNKVKATSIIK